MNDLLHTHLGVSDAIYNELLEIVPKAIIDSLGEKTPNAVKANAIEIIYMQNKYDEIKPLNERFYAIALVGMMVEQSYNAAVEELKRRTPFNPIKGICVIGTAISKSRETRKK